VGFKHTDSLGKSRPGTSSSHCSAGTNILRISSSNISFTSAVADPNSSAPADGGRGGVPLGDRTNEGRAPLQRVADRPHTRVAERRDPDLLYNGSILKGPRASVSAASSASGRGSVLVVGGQSAVKGVVAASPNEEARIAREAAAASRQERIRQVRRQLSAAARDQQRKQRELAQQRRDMARSRVHDAMLEEQSASMSALHESTAAGPADFGSAHLAAPQIVADTLEAARERRMEMLEEQRREQARFQLALQEEQLLKAMGPEAQAREINARRIRARAEEAEAARAEAAAWADKRAAALAAQQSDPNQDKLGPALLTQTVQVSNKDPIRPKTAGPHGSSGRKAPRPDYAQTHFHAVQILRHVPPSSAWRAADAAGGGVSVNEGRAPARYDEASLFDASGERAMLNAADAALAAAAISASRQAAQQYEKQSQEELRRMRNADAAAWLRKQQEAQQLAAALDKKVGRERLERRKEAGELHVRLSQELKNNAAQEARRKEADLLQALKGPPASPAQDAGHIRLNRMYAEEEEGWEDSLDDGGSEGEGGGRRRRMRRVLRVRDKRVPRGATMLPALSLSSRHRLARLKTMS
jgi:hypothetical protein